MPRIRHKKRPFEEEPKAVAAEDSTDESSTSDEPPGTGASGLIIEFASGEPGRPVYSASFYGDGAPPEDSAEDAAEAVVDTGAHDVARLDVLGDPRRRLLRENVNPSTPAGGVELPMGNALLGREGGSGDLADRPSAAADHLGVDTSRMPGRSLPDLKSDLAVGPDEIITRHHMAAEGADGGTQPPDDPGAGSAGTAGDQGGIDRLGGSKERELSDDQELGIQRQTDPDADPVPGSTPMNWDERRLFEQQHGGQFGRYTPYAMPTDEGSGATVAVDRSAVQRHLFNPVAQPIGPERWAEAPGEGPRLAGRLEGVTDPPAEGHGGSMPRPAPGGSGGEGGTPPPSGGGPQPDVGDIGAGPAGAPPLGAEAASVPEAVLDVDVPAAPTDDAPPVGEVPAVADAHDFEGAPPDAADAPDVAPEGTFADTDETDDDPG